MSGEAVAHRRVTMSFKRGTNHDWLASKKLMQQRAHSRRRGEAEANA